MMARLQDPIIEMSLLLKDIPYDIRLAKYSGNEGGYQVELYKNDVCGSGVSSVSFAMAYTAAQVDIECKLHKDAADFDELEQQMFLDGTRGL